MEGIPGQWAALSLSPPAHPTQPFPRSEPRGFARRARQGTVPACVASEEFAMYLGACTQTVNGSTCMFRVAFICYSLAALCRIEHCK